jgi:S-formylglutathione hydrolase FrmB
MWFVSSVLHASQPAKISSATKDDHGFLVHTVESEFQAGTTKIRVLLPEPLDPNKRYRVIYVLPVEAGDENRYGDGLLEFQRLDLANKHGVIAVAPTFSHLPWYADHPTDPSIRQESYFVQVVIPAVEARYPVNNEREGRLLLGFSKSGHGAFTLLLRHPETFGRAAAWDAPLAMEAPGRYGSGPIYGTPENFERYQISKLLANHAKDLGPPPRLAIFGYDNFRDQHETIRHQLEELKIPHIYRDGPQRKHVWSSGWISEAAEFLVR